MTKKNKIFVCINTKGGRSCIGPGSREVFRVLRQRARERTKAGGPEVEVERMTCLGYCSDGPNAKIYGGPVFNEVTTNDVEKILDMAEKTHLP